MESCKFYYIPDTKVHKLMKSCTNYSIKDTIQIFKITITVKLVTFQQLYEKSVNPIMTNTLQHMGINRRWVMRKSRQNLILWLHEAKEILVGFTFPDTKTGNPSQKAELAPPNLGTQCKCCGHSCLIFSSLCHQRREGCLRDWLRPPQVDPHAFCSLPKHLSPSASWFKHRA